MVSKLDLNKIISDIDVFIAKIKVIKNKIKYEDLIYESEQINIKMNNEAFWNNIQEASNLSTRQKDIQKIIKKVDKLEARIKDLNFLAKELPDEEDEIIKLHKTITKDINKLEVQSLLNGEYDKCDAYLDIHPGAGGVESHDFALMIANMYEKYFHKSGMKNKVISYHKGEVAGIKSITYEIKGENSFGILKNETGIHRLIRLSPFDSGNRRHTSFASVKVTPIIENEDFAISDKDLKIDTFRSSGAGGQSVNTTDSAVRITHIPSGIVVSCQNERSQIQNKEQALKILKSKLIVIEKEEQRNKSKNIVGELKSNSFGSQKRTYTLHPYKLVKDHVSGYETTQVEKILSGDIEDFIYSNLLK